MRKVLLDTDIGSDIDDAVCLAYLLMNPECELLGVTTVSGEPVLRAQMVSAICEAAGKAVPIFPGVADPLFVEQKQPHAPQAAALERWAHTREFPQGEAIPFLRETIRAYPGEVDLLTIGPLTNIALLFALDPELPAMLNSLTMMIGNFMPVTYKDKYSEWNCRCDPHAAAIVYRHRAPTHRSVGVDITQRVRMNAEQVRDRFTAPILQPVLDFAGVWFDKNEWLTFHDPLAAVTLFDSSICPFERGWVEVDVNDAADLGLNHWLPRADGPHEIAVDVNIERFFQHYFEVVNRE